MNRFSPRISRLNYFLAGLLFLSFGILQGCDGLNDINSPESTHNLDTGLTPEASTKLRHAAQLDRATRLTIGESGKTTTTTTDLVVAFNTYEADGITPRLVNKFELTKRILNEYGITRRVLNQYGITKRILAQYGITRRVLNQYGITKRVLAKYGLTPRMLGQYGDLVTAELLADLGITDAELAAEGLTQDELGDFNTLTSLVNTHNTSAEQFLSDLQLHEPDVRLKVYIDGENLGMSVSINEEVLNAFLEEIENDTDILLVEPDVQINVSHLGRLSGESYDHQIIPWGLTQTETPIPGILDVEDEKYISKNPVHVYILDSGAMPDTWMDDINYVEKKDFTMLFENPYQLEWEEDDAPDVAGFDPGDTGNPYDETGHGSHIAGTIGAHNNLYGVVGVAPSVRIHSLKVLNARGQTDITTLMAAVDYVTRAKQENPDWPIVVNMSFGVDIGTTEYNILDEAIAASIEEGVIYVAAAGNDGKNADTYSPAHVDQVITVGSYNEKEEFSRFSNFGSSVDVLAPGENIISLSHLIEDTRSFQAVLNSGTSHAAPHVTGAIARYLGEKPDKKVKDIIKDLDKASKKKVKDAPHGTIEKFLDIEKFLPGKKSKKEGKKDREKYYENRNDGVDDFDFND